MIIRMKKQDWRQITRIVRRWEFIDIEVSRLGAQIVNKCRTVNDDEIVCVENDFEVFANLIDAIPEELQGHVKELALAVMAVRAAEEWDKEIA